MDILFAGDLSFTWTPPLSQIDNLKIKTLSLLNKKYFYNFYGNKISKNIKDIISQSDFFCVNLECVLSNEGLAVEDKKYQLKADPNYIHTLKKIGVNVAALANNHILDYGLDSLNETISHLDRANIDHLGIRDKNDTIQKPLILSARDEKVALFNFVEPSIIDPSPDVYLKEDRHPFPLSEKAVLDSLDSFKDDIPKVVIFHFGTEWSFIESEQQSKLCRLCIDNGAEAVIGHHTHLAGRVEEYKGKPIFYGLGNLFMSLPRFSAIRASKRLLGKLTFKDNKITDYKIIPIKNGNDFFPKPDDEILAGSFKTSYLPAFVQSELKFDSLSEIKKADIEIKKYGETIRSGWESSPMYNLDIILGRLPVSGGFRANQNNWSGVSSSSEPIGNEFLTTNLTFLDKGTEIKVLFSKIPKLSKLYLVETFPFWFQLLEDFGPLEISMQINRKVTPLDKVSKSNKWDIIEIELPDEAIDTIELSFSNNELKYSYHLWRVLGI